MAAVELQGITKSFGPEHPVLSAVSLSIKDGEFLTFIGPSGCGKSTLLRIIAGLENQDSGSIRIAGAPVDALAPKDRDIAMVFQTHALYPHMTVRENLAMPLRMRRLGPWRRLPLVGRLLPGARGVLDAIEGEVQKAAKTLEIEALLDKSAAQLSGGQSQRVAIGRAIVRHPAVFLMDEPLSSLDAKLRSSMRAEIKELHRRLGVTFIYVTHDQAEAMTLSDRIAVMLDGTILQVGSPSAIYSDPRHWRVAELIGSPTINKLHGTTTDRGVEIGETNFPVEGDLPAGEPLILGIRPESLHLGYLPGMCAIRGMVRVVENLGSDLFVHVELASSRTHLIARLSGTFTHAVIAGSNVKLSFDPRDVLMFDRDGRRLHPTMQIAERSLS